MEEYIVDVTEEGCRLDAFLAAHTDLSRSAAVRLIEDGCATVDGRTQTGKKTPLPSGAVVGVTRPEVQPYEVAAQNIPLDIIYEDADLLVINKPKGMVVHPAAGNEDVHQSPHAHEGGRALAVGHADKADEIGRKSIFSKGGLHGLHQRRAGADSGKAGGPPRAVFLPHRAGCGAVTRCGAQSKKHRNFQNFSEKTLALRVFVWYTTKGFVVKAANQSLRGKR